MPAHIGLHGLALRALPALFLGKIKIALPPFHRGETAPVLKLRAFLGSLAVGLLLPGLTVDDENYGEVWFYEYVEDPDNVNAEPELKYIEDDDVYEAVSDAFEEFLDTQEFDEIIEDDNE